MHKFLIVLTVTAMLGLMGCSTGGLRDVADRTDNPDRALESEIYQRLQSESPLYASSIAIKVGNGGVVTVYGSQDDTVIRARIAAVIESTPGVTKVNMID